MNQAKINLKNLHFHELVEIGNNFIRKENLRFAEKYYDEALKKINTVSNSGNFYLNYAHCKLQLNKYDEAKKFYELSLSLNPNLYPALQSLALCEITLFNKNKNHDPLRALNSKNIKNASEKIYRAIKLNPDDIENYKYLAILFCEIDDLENAVKNFKKYLFVKFDLSLIKKYCSLLDEYSLDHDIFELCVFWIKSNKLNKEEIEYLQRRISIYYLVLNDSNRAEVYLKDCLQYRKYFAYSIYHLNQLKTFKANDDVVKNIEIGLNKNFFDDSELPILYQFLADVYEEIDDKAFISNLFLSKKARIKISKSNFRINESILKENSELLGEVICPIAREFRPIFIVGMPRSGTTLAHQVISNHSLVQGLGEFPYLPNILRNFSTKISSSIKRSNLQEFMSKVAQQYVLNAKFINSNKDIFVDKSPLNFMYLKHIVKMFPNAKIICCERDPIDTCWSIFRNTFTVDYGCFNKLEDISNSYKSYQILIDHWKKTLSENIFSLNYEYFVDNQTEITIKLLDFCNLSFEDKCLTPEKNTSIVKTLSKHQVRKKVNDANKRKWEKYKDHLKPLIDSLSNIK